MKLRAAATVLVSTALAASLGVPSAQASGPALKTRTTKLGTFLVDGKGRTLYLFQHDTRKDVSNCNSAGCVEVWPPALVSGTSAKVGGKAKSSLLKVITRKDGTHQLSYAGHPLYRYLADSKAGQVQGQGVKSFGAEWYVVGTKGKKIDHGD